MLEGAALDLHQHETFSVYWFKTALACSQSAAGMSTRCQKQNAWAYLPINHHTALQKSTGIYIAMLKGRRPGKDRTVQESS